MLLRMKPFLTMIFVIIMNFFYSNWTLTEFVFYDIPFPVVVDVDVVPTTTTTTTENNEESALLRNGTKNDITKKKKKKKTVTTKTNIITFEPGSLNMTRKETLDLCYIDPVQYRKHYNALGTGCSFSTVTTPKIVYYFIAKSGSTTARLLMSDLFSAKEKQFCNMDALLRRNNNDGKQRYHQFTLTREPSDRFMSAYSEMMKRWALRILRTHMIPTKYRKFLDPVRDRPNFLFFKLYRTEKGQKLLMESLRLFLEHYDGEEPFDTHLRQQVPRFYNVTTGRTMSLDAIYDVNDAGMVFTKFAQIADPPRIVNESSTHKHVRQLRLNTTGQLSDKHLRKLCQLSALDYCCLNYELPEVCRGAFQCQWVHKPDIARKDEDGFLIDVQSPLSNLY